MASRLYTVYAGEICLGQWWGSDGPAEVCDFIAAWYGENRSILRAEEVRS
jgi:hypothetical protein